MENICRVAAANTDKKASEANIDEKWEKTGWAKKFERSARRAQLTDFDRFKVMLLRKRRAQALKKALA